MKHGVGCLRWNKNKTFLLCLSSDIFLSLSDGLWGVRQPFPYIKIQFCELSKFIGRRVYGFFLWETAREWKRRKKSHWIGKTYSGMIHHQSDKIKKKRREYIIEIVCEWAMMEAYHFILSSNRDDDDDVYLLNGCETMKVVKTYN